MPTDTRGRSTKQGSEPPSQPCRIEPAHHRNGIKVMQDTSYPTAAVNMKVINRSLAANSPEYLVPLIAAVTLICVPGWALILTSQW